MLARDYNPALMRQRRIMICLKR